MYIYMGERIAGKQDRSSLIIEDPLRAPKIPPKYTFFYILGHKWKTGFQIVSPCCTYVSTVMRSAFCWHFGAPGTPGFYVRARHDPEKMIFFFIFFILTQKVLIRLLLYLTCKLLLIEGILCEPRWAQWLLNPPPPPPGPPYSQRCKYVFTYM